MVSQYDAFGGKSSVLVFAVVFRDSDGHLDVEFLDSGCADKDQMKCDHFFAEAAWDMHMRNGSFEGVDKIYRSGDNGKPFNSRHYLHFEAQFKVIMMYMIIINTYT
jgi:hypothetical protein